MASNSYDPAQFDTVAVDTRDYIGRITLSRPESMNTFSTQLAGELDEALRAFDDDGDIRAIVIDGVGDAFSAGIDLTEHGEYETRSEYETWVANMEEPFLTLKDMRTPVIAAAHGHAAANGLGLVAACDLAVAAENTQFGATAPKVGLFCMGPAVPLMETLSEKRCLELILTGKLIDAETAVDWGLVNRIGPEGEHLDIGMELAEEIASKSPTAVQRGKRAYYEMKNRGYADALSYSNEQFAKLCTTPDANEGIDAFLSGNTLGPDEWPDGGTEEP